ncbi:hypothetical protein CYMTET_39687 [Cymbomonas tetramitiformis]|uniref:Iron hydrogenase small subunit domain-containing protein n=1 Tax=Cymbomonas tetramitiformis TaxID=36881 RepID=A0AAE0F490_9CHLO|nr:hypothetical protein CYMTET_39687 [Cymbomonas tetramitiformis]
MGFSTGLAISDLNDYIAPSQSCVVSLNADSKVKLEDDLDSEYGAVKLHSRQPAKQESAEKKSDPVKISLQDCLACSGCVTSAETVLLEQQSTEELNNKIEQGFKIVFSVSPQSRASLAAYFKTTPKQVFGKLTTWFKSLGAYAVLDTSCARDFSLIESAEEFVHRYQSATAGEIPMLASACPGWVCYAEKTHGSYVLPYISATKSPQQVMGSIVKRYFAERHNLRPQDIYHVSVMPCFDKKLEASRDDFLAPAASGASGEAPADVPEVDCVITTIELLSLAKEKEVDLATLQPSVPDQLVTGLQGTEELHGAHGSAGGYLEHIFRHAALRLFGRTVEGPLVYKTLRNADFKEVALEVEGKPVLKFAAAYGFRNIQTLLRKIKLKKSEYHFVEIMACPSGCLNGAGQSKGPGDTPEEAKQFLEDVEAAYYHSEVQSRMPEDNPVVQQIYSEWLDGPSSATAKGMLHTQYHPREKTVGVSISNW